MYIFTTLKFPTYNFDFHLLTKSVNAKYCYLYIIYIYIYMTLRCTYQKADPPFNVIILRVKIELF